MSLFIDKLKEKYGDDFFKEEIRCEYLVTEKMKQVWAVELDLLEKFIEVCEKHNLTYYAIGGTLLGAVRHRGFIPWDDDIDVAMPRKDYEKLLLIGEKEFKHPYFLQTPHTDSNYGFSFAKVRNSLTTIISPKLVKEKDNMNMGCMLDIFPIDITRYDKNDEIRDEILLLIQKNSFTMKKNSIFVTEDDKKLLDKYYDENNNMINTYEEIQTVAQRYSSDKNADIAGINVFWPSSTYKRESLKEWYEDRMFCNFEHLKISVPNGYDGILSKAFGNYMEFPPESQRFGHKTLIYPDIPYQTGIEMFIKSLKSKSI